MEGLTQSQHWKNFRLGRELHVAGSFIFNGILHFHHIKHFSHEDEIFEFLYNVAVGLERLLKISIVLVEHDEAGNQTEFENSLVTHNHQELVGRLRKQRDLKLSSVQNAFIQLLSNFYKSYRYDRFRLESIYNAGREKEGLRNFLAIHLKVEIKEDSLMVGTENDQEIRSKMAELISDMARKIYKIISNESTRLNIYIYELRYDSKASILFQNFKTDFSIEDRAVAEFLIFLINTSESNEQLKLIREIKPLDLDLAMVGEFIRSLNSYAERSALAEMIESAYEDLEGSENLEKRKATLDFLISEQFDNFSYIDRDNETEAD